MRNEYLVQVVNIPQTTSERNSREFYEQGLQPGGTTNNSAILYKIPGK